MFIAVWYRNIIVIWANWKQNNRIKSEVFALRLLVLQPFFLNAVLYSKGTREEAQGEQMGHFWEITRLIIGQRLSEVQLF